MTVNNVTILFGTESGNSEMVADEMTEALTAKGIAVRQVGMEDYAVSDLPVEATVILVTSTYGEGDLPETTAPFYEELMKLRPDLSGLEFAAFGLGDSSYETYNLAITKLTGAFVELGARQLGATGFHDADTGLDHCEVAVAWAEEVFEPVLSA